MKCLAGKQAGRHPAYRSALGEPAAFFLFVVFNYFLKNKDMSGWKVRGKASNALCTGGSTVIFFLLLIPYCFMKINYMFGRRTGG